MLLSYCEISATYKYLNHSRASFMVYKYVKISMIYEHDILIMFALRKIKDVVNNVLTYLSLLLIDAPLI